MIFLYIFYNFTRLCFYCVVRVRNVAVGTVRVLNIPTSRMLLTRQQQQQQQQLLLLLQLLILLQIAGWCLLQVLRTSFTLVADDCCCVCFVSTSSFQCLKMRKQTRHVVHFYPGHHQHHIRLFKVVKRSHTHNSSPVNTRVPSYSKTFNPVQSVVWLEDMTRYSSLL